MKIKENVDLEVLLDYGFTKIDKKQAEKDEDWTISCYEYLFEIGYARRGQFYYLLVSEKAREIIIYASEPDGSGGTIDCPNVLKELVVNDIIE
jgi:hypothetical protein